MVAMHSVVCHCLRRGDAIRKKKTFSKIFVHRNRALQSANHAQIVSATATTNVNKLG